MSKIITRVCNILSTLILILAIGVCAALLLPKAFGYEIYSVLSGSMEPTYHVGSVVYIDKGIQPEEIEAGDPIAFYKQPGVVATHRAIEVDQKKQEFVTKGDANEVADADSVSYTQLIGKAIFTIPLLGYVSIYIRTSRGIVVATAIVAIVILLYAIPAIVEPEKGGKNSAKK